MKIMSIFQINSSQNYSNPFQIFKTATPILHSNVYEETFKQRYYDG